MPYTFATVALLTQIFLPCYFAEQVIANSTMLAFDAYNCNWIEMIAANEQGRVFATAFKILLEGLKRDRNVIVGRIYPLSLTTFKTVTWRVDAVSNQSNWWMFGIWPSNEITDLILIHIFRSSTLHIEYMRCFRSKALYEHSARHQFLLAYGLYKKISR